jgi:hypothetical protein
VTENQISTEGITTINQCFEISRAFAIEVLRWWKTKFGLNEFYSDKDRINLLYGFDSRKIEGELLGAKDFANGAEFILSKNISIQGFNTKNVGKEIKIKSEKNCDFELHVHVELPDNGGEVVLSQLIQNRFPTIKRTKENRRPGQTLPQKFHEKLLLVLENQEFTCVVGNVERKYIFKLNLTLGKIWKLLEFTGGLHSPFYRLLLEFLQTSSMHFYRLLQCKNYCEICPVLTVYSRNETRKLLNAFH